VKAESSSFTKLLKEKRMSHIDPDQRILLSAEYLFDVKTFSEFETLFSYLPRIVEESQITGRPKTEPLSLLRSLIYRSSSGISNLSALRRILSDNPSLCLRCGFDPLNLPPVERFSSFLKTTSPSFFKRIQIQLVRRLIRCGVVSGKYLSIDAAPVPIQCRENNPKVSMRKSRFDKRYPPQADPEAGLGVMLNYPRPFEKKVAFFWGYKNHILSDTASELPLFELTKPANVNEGRILIPLIKKLKEQVEIHPEAVAGDGIYDSEDNLKFILQELKAKPVIARNLRWEKYKDYILSKKGAPICIAGLKMTYWGRFHDRGRVRLKYVCPIVHLKSYRQKYYLCPWNHPKFTKGKGCYVYLRADDTVRDSIDYGSVEFKRLYTKRTASERINSRLASLGIQSPSVRGFRAVSNWCSITHITLLLIALAAYQTDKKDQIRFVKNFLSHL